MVVDDTKSADVEKTGADIDINDSDQDESGDECPISPASTICSSLASNTSSSPTSTTCSSPASTVCSTDLKTLPPENKSSRLYRKARHVYFNVYRRLFAIVLVLNVIGVTVLETTPFDLEHYLRSISTAASANFCVAVLARQDYIINALFDLYVLIPKSAPLALRRRVAKVYEFGGVHSGAAFCGTLWFLRLVVLMTTSFSSGTLGGDIPGLVLVWVVLMLFIGIIVFAHPSLRSKQHNMFERTHRFAGWCANAIFWVVIVLVSNALADRAEEPRSTGQILVTLPSIWLLSLNTLHTINPWLRLRKLPATAEPLSDMAVRLHLNANIKPFYTIRLSDSPLTEWHSFACFPDSNPVNGSTNSVIIAKAGDWTAGVIASPKPYYWTRGLPTRGVLYMSLLFKRVVVVTTGSGIGPCLNLLGMKPETRPSCRVLWSTPNPGEFYGDAIIGEVKQCDPNAIIWDTKAQGRPDMIELTWKLVMEMDAEAVFCVSNPKVTKKVVYGMESRGIPAYGPIFDS